MENSTFPPFLEVDLITRTRTRWHEGYSKKNPLMTDESGMQYHDLSGRPIIHWLLSWRFALVIINNSNAPAYNVSVESIGKIHFASVDTLPKKNNIPPLGHVDLNARYEERIESEYQEADKILSPRIPDKFTDFSLKVTCFDDMRNPHYTRVTCKDGELINEKV